MSVCRNCEEKIGGYCHGCMNNTVDTLTAQLDTYKQALHLVYQLGNTYRHGVNVSGVEVGEIVRQALKEVG